MRADLGFLLIGLGLAGVYVVLSGKFPPQASGNSSDSSQTPPQGDVGVSTQSALRVPLLRASTGAYRQ